MKHITASLAVFALALTPLSGGEIKRMVMKVPVETPWTHTLAVTDGKEHFSFSLMKEGWLSYDTWSEGKDVEETRINVDAGEFAEIQKKFIGLFEELGKGSLEEGPAKREGISYAFEGINRGKSETYSFEGDYPQVEAMLKELKVQVGQPYPFLIDAVAKEPENFVIEIGKHGINADGEAVTEQLLKEKLKALAEDQTVLVRAADEIEFSKVTPVLGWLAEAGITKVTMATVKTPE